QFETIWRKEYVPIFRPSDAVLAPDQATQLLYRSGYLPQPQVASAEVLKAAVRSFQQAMGVPDTGELDTETILLLTGPFLTGVPTLEDGF
ncbi:MAG TPA: peptidoglycan-binding domain-containing protein, partial [Allocoleopsis sp.]